MLQYSFVSVFGKLFNVVNLLLSQYNSVSDFGKLFSSSNLLLEQFKVFNLINLVKSGNLLNPLLDKSILSILNL